MSQIGSFDDYLSALAPLRQLADPTLPTPESEEIRQQAIRIGALDEVSRDSIVGLIQGDPAAVPVLGLVVGLGRESLKNSLRHHLGSSGWVTLARERPGDVVDMLDAEYDLVRLVESQRFRTYDLGDVLVARAGTRVKASAAGKSGRSIEDQIEAVAVELGLPYETRTRFVGRGGLDAPCDIAIPAGGDKAQVVVAAKGFDSTGSKLSDAVREIGEMAERRLPTQWVGAVVDGVGWKSRIADLRRIYDMRTTNQIDGLYTLATMDDMKVDITEFARIRGML